MHNLKKLAEEILTDGYIMHLATSLNDKPWSATVAFSYDTNFSLYWLSYKETRHSENIAKNPFVAATIMITNEKYETRGLQLEGEAKIITDDKQFFAIEAKYRRLTGRPMPKDLDEAKEAAGGRILYKLTPSKIYMHHETLFGYTRKEVKI